MLLETYDRLGGEPVRRPASLVICRNRYGDPIMVAMSHDLNGEEAYVVAHAQDPDFNRVLAALGIHQQVFCEPFIPTTDRLPIVVP